LTNRFDSTTVDTCTIITIETLGPAIFTFDMFSPVLRPIFTTLLAGLLLLGNAPAWWHHGSCDGESCHASEVVVKSKGSCGSSHCCRAHVELISQPLQVAQVSSSSHDSADCFACQSAVAGIAASIEPASTASFSPSISYIIATGESSVGVVSLELGRPRGPPALFA